jgi:putative endopeptidase
MSRSLKAAVVLLGSFALAGGCGGARQSAPLQSGVVPANMDTTVRPQDDFYRYANGGWIDHTDIPPDLPTIGSFVELFIKSENQRHEILEELASKTDVSETEKKLADFYASFMDSARIESAGAAPLEDELARIAAIQSKGDLLALFGRNWRLGVQSPLNVGVDGDFEDSRQELLYIGQSGIGLPNRDYFLKDDPRLLEVRRQYEAHIARMFELAGIGGGKDRAHRIIALETSIARAQWPLQDAQDVTKTHNKYAVADLSKLGAGLEWGRLFEGAGIKDLDHVNVSEPTYCGGLAKLVRDTDLGTWKDYASFKLINASAPLLSTPFVDAAFEFNRVVAGVRSQPERWKRGTRLVEGGMGMALGKIYVDRYFPPTSKARMDQLVANVLEAMKENIDELEWMGPETRAKAQAKLASFTPQIGYPKEWRDYGALEIKRDDVLGNARRANEFEFNRNLNKLGKPVDRDEWGMTPQTINAYYDPPLNKIVFPAAILQPPFFDPSVDDAFNYGAIGAVIGHEISHGFDDDGRKYDGDGNLKDWWTPEDDAAFNKRADMLVEQFDQFTPQEGLHVNGRLTLGENIGDLSGMTIAYRAYKKSLGGKEAPVLGGLTGDQRFFMGWATIWRSKMTDQLMRLVVLSNEHAPSMYRVNGTVSNMPEFYQAFNVKPGDRLYRAPEDRVKLW